MMASNPWREGFEAIMFRTVSDQVSLWEAVLPPELLTFLKFRYRLGYESLCREVSDSITWRRCPIPRR
jgi:transposase, IS5 family